MGDVAEILGLDKRKRETDEEVGKKLAESINSSELPEKKKRKRKGKSFPSTHCPPSHLFPLETAASLQKQKDASRSSIPIVPASQPLSQIDKLKPATAWWNGGIKKSISMSEEWKCSSWDGGIVV